MGDEETRLSGVVFDLSDSGGGVSESIPIKRQDETWGTCRQFLHALGRASASMGGWIKSLGVGAYSIRYLITSLDTVSEILAAAHYRTESDWVWVTESHIVTSPLHFSHFFPFSFSALRQSWLQHETWPQLVVHVLTSRRSVTPRHDSTSYSSALSPVLGTIRIMLM